MYTYFRKLEVSVLLLSLLILFNFSDSFDEVDIAANSFVFFIGGYETTSLTLSYCLYELALNQEIQEKLLAKILQAYNKNGGKIDFNSFHDMPYLDAVISGKKQATFHIVCLPIEYVFF